MSDIDSLIMRAVFVNLQNGISICLMFLEFFSLSAQRSALSVIASCCHDIVCVDDFRYVRDSLDTVIARLTQQVCISEMNSIGQ